MAQERRRNNYRNHQNEHQLKLEEFKTKWITERNQITDEMISWAHNIGKQLAENQLTTSQIRKFFGEMRRIQSSFEINKEDIPMLRAKLAYSVGRATKNHKVVMKAFYDLLTPALEAIDAKKENFNRFVKVYEAIVSFHKLYEEK